MEKEYKHNGLCTSDKLDQGWIIEGYPEPLTETRCEEIVRNDTKVKELENILDYAVCKKGCGDVKIELGRGGMECSDCGEDLENEITSLQYAYLKSKAPTFK